MNADDFIVPDRRVVAELRRLVSRHIGKRWANSFDIRWDERGCLCVFEKSREDQWGVRRELREPDGMPRQATMEDVEEVVANRYGWCEQVDNWKRYFYERKAKRAKERKAKGRELAEAKTKTFLHLLNGPDRAYVIPDPVRPERVERADELTITDRRRDFEVAS